MSDKLLFFLEIEKLFIQVIYLFINYLITELNGHVI